MSGETTKTGPTGIQRDSKGRIVAGSGAINGGGLTTEQRQARDALGKWLCEGPQIATGKAAYIRLLEADNPVIVKDFMDRVAGKVKEVVEHQGDALGPSLALLTRAEILAIARGEKPE